jgi:hypothetical protein
LLTDSGVLLFNLSCASNEIFSAQMDQIESVFDTTYTVENSEELHKIVICCKNSQQRGKTLISLFTQNNELFRCNTDIYLLANDYEKIVSKLLFRRQKRLVEK